MVYCCCLRHLMVLLVKNGGMELLNPVEIVDLSYLASVKMTRTLIETLQKGDPEAFDLTE